MHKGAFFNRQRLGLTVKNFEKESNINKRYQITATIKSTPFNIHYQTPQIENDNEFIAILESLDIPLYFILYDVSAT